MPLLVPVLPIVFWDRPSWSFDAAASEPQSSSLHVAICHGKLQVLIVQCGKHSFLRSLISFWGLFFLPFLLITQSKEEENQKFSYALHTYCPESVQKSRIEFLSCCCIGHDSCNLPEEVLKIEQVHISKVCPKQVQQHKLKYEFWLDSLLDVTQYTKIEKWCNK